MTEHCPYCGSSHTNMVTSTHSTNGGATSCYIECTVCLSRGPIVWCFSGKKLAENEAKRLWDMIKRENHGQYQSIIIFAKELEKNEGEKP